MRRVLSGEFIWYSGDSRPTFFPLQGPQFLVDTSGHSIEESRRVIATFDDDKLVSARPDPADPDIPQKHVRCLMTRYLKEDQEVTEARIHNQKVRAKEAQDVLNRAHQGYITFDIVPYVISGHHSVGLWSRGAFTHAEEAAKESGLGEDWDWIYLIGGRHSNYSGVAGGSRGVTYTNGSSRTDKHEMGHLLGYMHDFGYVPDGPNLEYGGPSWMGNSRFRHWYHPMHLHRSGVLHDTHVNEIEYNESREAYLVDSDTLELAVPLSCDRVIYMRQPAGHGSSMVNFTAIQLKHDKIRIWRPGPGFGSVFSEAVHLKSIKAGQTWEDTETKQRVHFVSYKDGVATIEIHNGNFDIPVVKKQHSPEFPIPDQGSTFENKTGLWANRDNGRRRWTHQGVYLRKIGENQLHVDWLTWNEGFERTKTEAYNGTLTFDKNYIARGDLSLNGKVVAYATVYFMDNKNGMFYVRFYDGDVPYFGDTSRDQMFASPLERVAKLQETPQSGVWNIHKTKRVILERSVHGRLFGFLIDGRRWYQINENENDELVYYEHEGGIRGSQSDATLEEAGPVVIRENEIEIMGETLALYK